jgi:hypothetical protein
MGCVCECAVSGPRVAVCVAGVCVCVCIGLHMVRGFLSSSLRVPIRAIDVLTHVLYVRLSTCVCVCCAPQLNLWDMRNLRKSLHTFAGHR